MSFLERLEGMVPPRIESGWPATCDECTTPIDPGMTFRMYLCNVNYGPDEQRSGFEAGRYYGPCCDRRSIRFPCKGVTEALLQAETDLDFKMRNVEVVDFSKSDDGVPWDPPNMWKLFVGQRVEEHLDDPAISWMKMGPEDVYDALMTFGVDPKTIVNENGEVVVSRDKITEMQHEVREKSVKLFNQ